jgi:hypothetical protein
MNFIITIISIFTFLILVLSFVRYNLAIALYLSHTILVPYFELKLAGITFGANLINFVLLSMLIFNFHRKKVKLNFIAIKPFLFLFISLLLISFFADMRSSSIQLNLWRSDFMRVCILSFIIWNVAINEKKIITYIKWTLIVSFLIAGIYAISIMNLDGLNPYTSFMTAFYGQEYDFAEVYAADSGRVRNQGTMSHPMTWVNYLSGFTIVCLSLFYMEKKKYYLLLVCFCVFNIVIADVRTGLASTMIAAGYISYRYNKINLKTILYSIIVGVILVTIVIANEKLSERFVSMVDINGTKSNIGGSSFQMRIEQFNGCLKEIERSPIFGKGYGWTTHYRSVNFRHPVIIVFESLIFVIICNHGAAGFVIWSVFAFMLFRMPRKILSIPKNVYLIDGLVVFFFTYSIITGLYQYLVSFAMFYSFLLAHVYIREKKEKN